MVLSMTSVSAFSPFLFHLVTEGRQEKREEEEE